MAESSLYPNALDTTNLYEVVARLSTTLAADITASTTTIPLAATTGFPTQGYIVIDNETIKYISVSVGSVDATGGRGHAGTAASHTSGTQVLVAVTAAVINKLRAGLIAVQTALGVNLLGWTPAGETWTFLSVDDPTGLFTVSGDVTTKYSAGMKIKMTNDGNVIYGIISKAPSYSAPNTTITFLHEIDPTDNLALYLMANSAITLPYYSTQKAPFGFPLNPLKWSIKITDTTSRTQATPTASTWYNLGSISITIPIGIWDIDYRVKLNVYDANGADELIASTLSTGNNTETDKEFTQCLRTTATACSNLVSTVYARKFLELAAKTIYYLNTRTELTGVDNITNKNDETTLAIRAICAFL